MSQIMVPLDWYDPKWQIERLRWTPEQHKQVDQYFDDWVTQEAKKHKEEREFDIIGAYHE